MGGASSGTVSNVSRTPKRRRRADRHDQALLTAEVRQLAAQLHTSGPSQRDVLAKRWHTSWWHDDCPRPSHLPEGTAEAMPVALTLIAVSIPVTLLALAATGGGVPLLVAAILSMVLVCMVIAIVLGRKLADDPPVAPASDERFPQRR